MKDPVCGMAVKKIEAVRKNLVTMKKGKYYYFCSKNCKEIFQGNIPFYKTEKFGTVFPYFLAFLLVSGSVVSVYFNLMTVYMGIFFVVFSLFKIPDWKGFVVTFKQYDFLARFVPFYAWLYPVTEFVLGILFLTNSFVTEASYIVVVLLGTGAIAVGIKLLKRDKFQCACLGTWLNVPLTKVTFLEDVLMVMMAAILIY